MTVQFTQMVGDEGHVYSFEADPFTFSLLKKNIEANNKQNVTPVFGAVSNKNGEKVFYPEPHLLRFHSYGSYGINPRATSGRQIPTHTIDSLEIQGKVDFMKVDVQGSDLFAMQGAKKLIEKNRMPILFEFEEQFQEEFGTSKQNYMDFVDEIGYRIERVINDINYLIVPDSTNPSPYSRRHSPAKTKACGRL